MAKIQEVSAEVSLRNAILNTVNNNQGIKGVELVLHVMSMVGPVMFDDREYMLELSRLLDDGEIIEVEYLLPQLEYRLKSLYFPKGTRINAPEAHTTHDGGATVLRRI